MAWSDVFQGVKDAIYSAQEKQEIEEKAQKKEKQIAASNSPVYSQGVSIEHGNGSRTAKPNAWESIAREAMDYLTAAQNRQAAMPSVAPARKLSEFTPFDDSRYMYEGSDSGDDLTWRKLRVLDKDTGKESYMEVGYKDLFDKVGSPGNPINLINGVRFYDDDKINEYRDSDSIDKAIRKHFDLDATRYTIYDTDKRWMDDSRGGPYGNGSLTGGSAYDAVLFDTDDEEASDPSVYAGRFTPQIFSRWSMARRKEGLDEDLADRPNRSLIESTYYGDLRAPEEATEAAKNGMLYTEDITGGEQPLDPYEELARNNISLRHSDEEIRELSKYKNDILDLAAAYVFEPDYKKRQELYADFAKEHGIDGENTLNKYGQTKILRSVTGLLDNGEDASDWDAEARKRRASWMLREMDDYLRLLRTGA